MDLSAVIFIEILYAVASLIMISAGLAVVFGMMKVINLAHGEFMMMGGVRNDYCCEPWRKCFRGHAHYSSFDRWSNWPCCRAIGDPASLWAFDRYDACDVGAKFVFHRHRHNDLR